MKIRFATIADLSRIVEIYNSAIIAGNITADLVELNIEDREEWFFEHHADKYPLYVLEKDAKVIGWGSLSPYRKGRGAFRETAEISYYIDYDFHGMGYGKRIMKHIIDDCARLGIRNLIAFVLEINAVSLAILERYGFKRWGFLPNIVNLNKLRCSHLIYGINLYDTKSLGTNH